MKSIALDVFLSITVVSALIVLLCSVMQVF